MTIPRREEVSNDQNDTMSHPRIRPRRGLLRAAGVPPPTALAAPGEGGRRGSPSLLGASYGCEGLDLAPGSRVRLPPSPYSLMHAASSAGVACCRFCA